MGRHPEPEQEHHAQRRRHQRVEPERQIQPEHGVHADHHELAVGEVDDLHQPEDEAQARRDERVDEAHQEPADDGLDDDLGGQGILPGSGLGRHGAASRFSSTLHRSLTRSYRRITHARCEAGVRFARAAVAAGAAGASGATPINLPYGGPHKFVLRIVSGHDYVDFVLHGIDRCEPLGWSSRPERPTRP